MRWRALIVVTVGAGDTGAEHEASDGEDTPPSKDPQNYDGVEAFVDATRRLARRENTLVAECMAEAGFDFESLPEDQPAGSDAISAVIDSTKDDDPEYRAREGYGYSKVADTIVEHLSGHSQSTDPASLANEQNFGRLPPTEQARWSAALFGKDQAEVAAYTNPETGEVAAIPAAGCYAEVRRELFGELVTYLRVRMAVDVLNREWTSAIEDDPTLSALEAEWADCMGTHGYATFRTRADAQSHALDLYRDGSTNRAKIEERAVAHADAGLCRTDQLHEPIGASAKRDRRSIRGVSRA